MTTLTATPTVNALRHTSPVRRSSWVRRLPLLPALVFMIVVTQIPFLLTVWYSLQSWNLLHPGTRHFVGLRNYKVIFTDTIFRTAVFNTVIFTVLPVFLSMVFGTVIALLLDRHVFGRGFLRTLIVSPFLVMPAAAALVWKFTILDPVFGILNYFLRPFGVHHVDWINAHPQATIITVLTWQWTPFMVLIMLAGLRALPKEPFEAAAIDGASAVQSFFLLTLPMLRKVIAVAVLIRGVDLFRIYDYVYIITAGGPGTATETLSFYAGRIYFTGDFSYAATLSLIIVVVLIGVSDIFVRLFKVRF